MWSMDAWLPTMWQSKILPSLFDARTLAVRKPSLSLIASPIQVLIINGCNAFKKRKLVKKPLSERTSIIRIAGRNLMQ